MKSHFSPVEVAVEKWNIPTYRVQNAEEMPMFAETSNHQGTTGNPYPSRVISQADGINKSNEDWTVIRLENDYIRLAIIPALGGRIFEAYDKVTGYDFLYRQHVIKPALIGAYGLWISGGLEFNWPFHHRPSTLMPVDYQIETEDDGSVIVWLSEHAPNDRTKGMVGVVLRPESSYLHTKTTDCICALTLKTYLMPIPRCLPSGRRIAFRTRMLGSSSMPLSIMPKRRIFPLLSNAFWQ